MAPAATPSKSLVYAKRSGVADTLGQDYEVDICALLFLRALRLCSDFYLASNHGDAGAFDDVVMVYQLHGEEMYRAILLQAKHKKKTKVTLRTLTGPKNDFSLVKYLSSFLEVNDGWTSCSIGGKELKLQEVVYALYTNAAADLVAVSDDVINREYLGQLLLTGGSVVQISYERVRDALLEADSGVVAADLSHLKCFLESLVLCFNQMNHVTATRYLDEEINQALYTRPANVSAIRERIRSLVQNWWAQCSDVSYLTKDSALWETVVVKEMERVSEKVITRLPLVFTQRCLQELQTILQHSNQFVAFLVNDDDEGCLLCLKLWQALEKRLIVLHAKNLQDRLPEASGIWRTQFYDVLVINNSSGLETEWRQLKLPDGPSKRLVVLTKESPEGEDWTVHKERSAWEDLESSCVKDLLSCPVSLQGTTLSLEEYAPSVTETMSSAQILNLANRPEGEELVLGQHLPESVPYYVPRILERKAILEESFFSAIRTQSAIVAVVGIGKEELQGILGSGFTMYSYEDILESEIAGCTCVVLLPEENFHKLFSDLCYKYDCIMYLLKFTEGVFVCAETRDGLSTVRNLIKDKVSDRIDCVWDTTYRNVIVEGLPGMGKSCLMSWVGEQVKAANPAEWVLRVDLGSLSDRIQQRDFQCVDDIKDFLGESCLVNKDPRDLEKVLFSHALEFVGNVTILLDAFDEISPDYTDKCLRLLKGLVSYVKYRQIVVTTRPVTSKEVEDVLGTMAFTLRPFVEDQQKSFFRNYCKVEHLQRDDALIYNAVNSVGQCLEVPLLAFMAAEGMLLGDFKQKDVIKSHGKVNLYNMFVDRQIRIFLFDKHGISTSRANQKQMIRDMMKIYSEKLMSLAVKTLLNGKERDQFGYRDEDEGLQHCKLGLVVCYGDKIDFIHRTFAEFFFGMWLSRNFKKYKDNIENVLLRPNFDFVRESFDRFLYHGYPLHSAVAEGDVAEVDRLLLTVRLSASSVDAGGRTALHVAVLSMRNDSGVWSLLIDAGAVMGTKDEVLRWSALTYAEALSNWEAVEFLLGKGSSPQELRLLKEERRARIELRESCKKGYSELPLAILQMHKELLNKGLDWRGCTALHCASESGAVPLVRSLVDAGADLDAVDNSKWTAVIFAALKGHVDVVAYLKEKGASMAAGDVNVLTAAMYSGHPEIVNYLKYGEFADGEAYFVNEVIQAAIRNDESILAELLSEGRDCGLRDQAGMTALHWSASCGSVDAMKVLLGTGTDVDTADNLGYTPLMWAAMNGHADAVRYLLGAGAEARAASKNGSDALVLASIAGRGEVTRLLLDAGADVSSANRNGNTALALASYNGHAQTAGLLLRAGARTDDANRDGVTPLMWASMAGHLRVAELLLAAGASVGAADKDGDTALSLASANGHLRVADSLLDAGADADARDNAGNTALIRAAYKGDVEMVLLLLSAGADISVSNRLGRTALTIASANGHADVAQLLLEIGAKQLVTASVRRRSLLAWLRDKLSCCRPQETSRVD